MEEQDYGGIQVVISKLLVSKTIIELIKKASGNRIISACLL
jgi:hypothetical protein